MLKQVKETEEKSTLSCLICKIKTKLCFQFYVLLKTLIYKIEDKIEDKVLVLNGRDKSLINLGGEVNPLHQELNAYFYHIQSYYETVAFYNVCHNYQDGISLVHCEICIDNKFYEVLRILIDCKMSNIKDAIESNKNVLFTYHIYRADNKRLYTEKTLN